MVESSPNPLGPSAKVVDLFCGIGGLSHGFVQAGFDVVAGIDSDASCEETYKANNDAEFLIRDIANSSTEEIDRLFEKADIKILVGCAPCQPFSVYNNKIQKEVHDETSKWQLLYNFAEIIESTRPHIVSMENVPQLLRFNEGKVFDDFKKRLEECGYFISKYVVDAKEYGVPQRRKRLVVFGSLFAPVAIINPTVPKGTFVSVRDAIGNLPPIDGGESHPDDPLHRARKLSDLNIRRIRATPQGGFWRDWEEELKLECHKKDSGTSFRSVYGRMRWDEVAPTITTYCIGLGNGRFGHPEQDRAITLREAALLQGFPLNYKFPRPGKGSAMQTIARHIGNAVPVGLSKAIAVSIKEHLDRFGPAKE